MKRRNLRGKFNFKGKKAGGGVGGASRGSRPQNEGGKEGVLLGKEENKAEAAKCLQTDFDLLFSE